MEVYEMTDEQFNAMKQADVELAEKLSMLIAQLLASHGAKVVTSRDDGQWIVVGRTCATLDLCDVDVALGKIQKIDSEGTKDGSVWMPDGWKAW